MIPIHVNVKSVLVNMGKLVDQLAAIPTFSYSLAYVLGIRSGRRHNLHPYPGRVCEWTLKHLSHHGALGVFGVPSEQCNFVYWVMI